MRRRQQILLWSLPVLFLVGVAAFVVWGYFWKYEFKTSGYFLMVHIDSPGERPVLVACFESFNRWQAQGWVENINDSSVRKVKDSRWQSGLGCMLADPFDGKPMRLENRWYQSISFFGRTLSWNQNFFMTDYAEWPDGRKVCKVVEIPDARVSKEITITLP